MHGTTCVKVWEGNEDQVTNETKWKVEFVLFLGVFNLKKENAHRLVT